MDLDGSTLRLTPGEHRGALLTSLELPPAREASGGFLLPADEGLVFVLCADEEVEVGAVVVVPPGLPCTVTSVHRATLAGEPVTVLELRSREGGTPDVTALLRRRRDQQLEDASEDRS